MNNNSNIDVADVAHVVNNDADVVDVVDNVVEVLSLLKESPHKTTKQIAASLAISERHAQRIIKKLKESNKIHRIGSDRSGFWKMIE